MQQWKSRVVIMCEDSLHCYAGIPQPALYQLLCKVVIHFVQPAWNRGLALVRKWYREEERSTCINMCILLCLVPPFQLINAGQRHHITSKTCLSRNQSLLQFPSSLPCKIKTECTKLKCSYCWLAQGFSCNLNQDIYDEPSSLRKRLRELLLWNGIIGCWLYGPI